jgi:hypothetical protein
LLNSSEPYPYSPVQPNLEPIRIAERTESPMPEKGIYQHEQKEEKMEKETEER